MMSSEKNADLSASQALQTLEIPFGEFKMNPFTMIIFGGTGDLSKRKLLPTLFHLYQENELPKAFSVLGFARSKMTDDQYRGTIKEAFLEFGEEPLDENKWVEFAKHLFYLSGSFEEDQNYLELCKRIEAISAPTTKGTQEVIYYLAVPPQVTPTVVEKLEDRNLCKGTFDTKIIVEKPFGRDRTSAVRLNRILRKAFAERQIYRIDHYLGKETVQNIIFFRFSNSIFEHLWNRHYIDHVQITVAEDLGIEHRSAFYEQSGVVRDVVQNHLMQLVGLVAMEPPVSFEADFIRDEKAKVFHSISPMDEESTGKFTVRGQYGPGKINNQDVPGYREEKGVPPDSNIPTFFAAKLYITNWRWTGVPFYIRTGKRLPRRVTEIAIEFKYPPLRLFGSAREALEPNILLLTIQPDEKISLRFGVKYPYSANQVYPVNMVFSYKDVFGTTSHPAYERLKGDLTLFVRQDAIETTWEIVDPIIAHWEKLPPSDFPNYAAGTWGPPEASLLLEKEGRRWITT
jgi:glucose-6-phosphate 1-dehydrogenase